MKKLIAFMITLSLISSCSKENSFPNKTTVNLSFYMDPPAFDPRKTGNMVDSTMSFMLFAGLNMTLPNGKIGPGIAERYEVSEDQKNYTFHLRDAKWSDGKPITAYDFENSWKKIIDPKFPSLTTKLFYCIKNAEKAANNELPINEVKINALNEKTLQVELEYPAPYFLNLTAFCAFFPAPSHIVNMNQTWGSNPASDFVSSGPFKMVHYKAKKEVVVEKNPYFWNADNVNIDQINIHIIEDANTALQMFESGKLDFLGSPASPLPYHAESTLKKNKEFRKLPIAGSSSIAFNTEKFPFNNASIRKAFSYAIDRKSLVESVTFNNQKPAKRVIPPPFESNDGDDFLPNNDIEKAKLFFQKGLQELNTTKDNLKITLQIPMNFIDKKISETLQRQIKNALGIEIKIHENPFATHMNIVRAHEHQMAIVRWIFQYNDVMNIFARFREKNSPVNYSLWNNSQFIDCLDQVNQTIDVKKRYEILENAEKLFIEDLPLSPLYHLNYLIITQENFQGVVVGEVGDLHFQFANKKTL